MHRELPALPRAAAAVLHEDAVRVASAGLVLGRRSRHDGWAGGRAGAAGVERSGAAGRDEQGEEREDVTHPSFMPRASHRTIG